MLTWDLSFLSGIAQCPLTAVGEIRSRSTSVPSINMTAVPAVPRTPLTPTLEGKGEQGEPCWVTARPRAAAGRFDSDLFESSDFNPSRSCNLGAVLK